MPEEEQQAQEIMTNETQDDVVQNDVPTNTVDTVQEPAVDYEKRYTDLQGYVNELKDSQASKSEELDQLKNQFQSLGSSLASSFGITQPEQESLYDQIPTLLPQFQTEITQLRSDFQQANQELSALRAEKHYEQFTQKYSDKFGGKDQFSAVQQALVQKFPNIGETVRNGQVSLDTALAIHVGQEVLQENSELLGSLLSAADQLKKAKSGNYVPGNGSINTNGSGGMEDSYGIEWVDSED